MDWRMRCIRARSRNLSPAQPQAPTRLRVEVQSQVGTWPRTTSPRSLRAGTSTHGLPSSLGGVVTPLASPDCQSIRALLQPAKCGTGTFGKGAVNCHDCYQVKAVGVWLAGLCFLATLMVQKMSGQQDANLNAALQKLSDKTKSKVIELVSVVILTCGMHCMY